MRIAICDDNKEWIDREKEYINRLQDIKIEYDVFYSGEELIEVYRSGHYYYDAIFLDMEMEELNGIKTANYIREYDRHVKIIFVTNHTKYMKESFECSPFRFFEKDIKFEEFRTVILKLIETLEEEKQALIINIAHKTVRLLYEDIVLIQSFNHCIHIETQKETHKTYSTNLTKLRNILSDNMFMQIHKSYIINISYVEGVSKDGVTLRGYNDIIPIKSTYRKELGKKLVLYNERKFLI